MVAVAVVVVVVVVVVCTVGTCRDIRGSFPRLTTFILSLEYHYNRVGSSLGLDLKVITEAIAIVVLVIVV